jgi:hypothetical protein
MLALDALAGDAPQVYAVLTTRSVETDPAAFYDARRAVLDALRRDFPQVRYCAIAEFTTGFAARSGGARRPHWNLLLKGVDPARVARARKIIKDAWCGALGADASRDAQYVARVAHEGGLLKYLALHFLKEAQAPPKSWRGKQRVTFSTSRNKAGGYFTLPVWKQRAQAQASLRLKRELWRVGELGIDGELALSIARGNVERAARKRWHLVHLNADPATGVVSLVPMFNKAHPFGARVTRTRAVQLAEASTAAAVLRTLTPWTPIVLPRSTREQLAMTAAAFRRGP